MFVCVFGCVCVCVCVCVCMCVCVCVCVQLRGSKLEIMVVNTHLQLPTSACVRIGSMTLWLEASPSLRWTTCCLRPTGLCLELLRWGMRV